MTKHPRIVITLEPVGDEDVDQRLKQALKSLWRRWRLRCRSVVQVEE